MLILNRREGESFVIRWNNHNDPSITAATLFAQLPITVTVVKSQSGQARIGVEAPPQLTILRSELL